MSSPSDQLANRIILLAQIISDGMQITPGRDAYVFTGSMNDVESLREALQDWRYRDFNEDKS